MSRQSTHWPGYHLRSISDGALLDAVKGVGLIANVDEFGDVEDVDDVVNDFFFLASALGVETAESPSKVCIVKSP